MTDQLVSVMFGGESRAARRNTARIAAFVETYVRTLNSAQAARVAGYAVTAAAVRGAELMRRPDVQEAIRLRQEELALRYQAGTENTIEELASTAFFDPVDFFEDGRLRDLEDVPKRARSALAGFKVRRVAVPKGAPAEEIVEVKFLDRLSAIDKLMRLLGLYQVHNLQKSSSLLDKLPRDQLKLIEEKLSAIVERNMGMDGEPGPFDTGRIGH